MTVLNTMYVQVATCAKISLVSRTDARISHLCMRVIFIIAIMVIIMVIIDMMVSITTCLVQFRDSWVGLVAEQRGRRMQVGANLSIIIIKIIVLNIIIIIIIIVPNIIIIIRVLNIIIII